MPKTSSQDRIIAALEEIAEAITNPKYREPFMNGNKENEILDKLTDIFTAYKKNDKEEKKKENSIRIERLPASPPRVTIYPSGTIVYNKIRNRIIEGTIINYDPKRRYYKIK